MYLSVLDIILACELLVSKDKQTLAEKAKELLMLVELDEHIFRKFPSQLSGGESQRAAVVRAVINDPAIVFANESTSALNSAYGKAVLVNEKGQSIIMVTHGLNSARRGNRIINLEDGVIRRVQPRQIHNRDMERHGKLNAFLSEIRW